jgi:hypothetical protein
MWKLKNSEGTEQLCHTLDEVATIILNAPILLEYTLKFIPLYEKPKPPRPYEIDMAFPAPLSNQD